MMRFSRFFVGVAVLSVLCAFATGCVSHGDPGGPGIYRYREDHYHDNNPRREEHSTDTRGRWWWLKSWWYKY